MRCEQIRRSVSQLQIRRRMFFRQILRRHHSL